jgi:hypothetical protein
VSYCGCVLVFSLIVFLFSTFFHSIRFFLLCFQLLLVSLFVSTSPLHLTHISLSFLFFAFHFSPSFPYSLLDSSSHISPVRGLPNGIIIFESTINVLESDVNVFITKPEAKNSQFLAKKLMQLERTAQYIVHKWGKLLNNHCIQYFLSCISIIRHSSLLVLCLFDRFCWSQTGVSWCSCSSKMEFISGWAAV